MDLLADKGASVPLVGSAVHAYLPVKIVNLALALMCVSRSMRGAVEGCKARRFDSITPLGGYTPRQ